MDNRELKALEIAARYNLRYKDGYWIVPSQTSSKNYQILFRPGKATCTCEDHELSQIECKHILAARFVAEREGYGVTDEIDTNSMPEKKKYPQNWSAYNSAQISEKRRFQNLLFELAKNVPGLPANHRGRPRRPVADMIFASAYKVYSTISSRRFGSDLERAFEDGYLSGPMHPNKVNTCLEDPELTPILKELVVKSSLPLQAIETCFAADSTGFSCHKHERWFDEKFGKQRSQSTWMKAHAMCGTCTHVVTALEVTPQHGADSPQFKYLVDKTSENFRINEVSADKAYLSRENLEQVHSKGGVAYIPFKTNSVEDNGSDLWQKMYFFYNYKREMFKERYHQRSNVESVFSMVKKKFLSYVRSLTHTASVNEVYCKFLCHNICVVIASQDELGISGEFESNKLNQQDDKPKCCGL